MIYWFGTNACIHTSTTELGMSLHLTFILMCRMIREEEKYYDVHIPIIALTAHTTLEVEGTKRIREDGMDFQLAKLLDQGQLMEAIVYINNSKLAIK